MKKGILLLILITTISIFSPNVIFGNVSSNTDFSAGCEYLPQSNDYQEISDLRSDIAEYVNEIGSEAEDRIPDVKEEDVLLEKAVKEHSGIQALKERIFDTEVLDSYLDTDDYVWIVPVNDNGYLFEVQLMKDMDIGIWEPVGVVEHLDKECLTLDDQLRISLQNAGLSEADYRYVLILGMAPIHRRVFLALSEEKIEYLIPARADAAVLLTDNGKYVTGKLPWDEYEERDFSNEGYVVYDYSKIVRATTWRSAKWIVLIIVCGTAAISGIVWSRRHSTNN